MQLRFKNTQRYAQCTAKLQQMFAGLPQEEARRWIACLLGHQNWEELNADGAASASDEQISLDQIAQRRQFQVSVLLSLAEIEERDALAVINALRPSANSAPMTVTEKMAEAEKEAIHPLAMGLGQGNQASFERDLQAVMRNLLDEPH